MDILVYSAAAILVTAVVTAVVMFSGKSGWFAFAFALFGSAAIGFAILTDLNGIIIALNSISALLFIAWIIAVNRKKKGVSNGSDADK